MLHEQREELRVRQQLLQGEVVRDHRLADEEGEVAVQGEVERGTLSVQL